MADAAVFEFVAGELERVAGLGRPAARAAVRSVLAKALYAPDSVSVDQMQRLIERLLPAELRASGVAEAERVCQADPGGARFASAGVGRPRIARRDLRPHDPPLTPDQAFQARLP